MNIPNEIYAGDKLEFTEFNSDFLPSAGWNAKIILINQNNKYTIDSTPDGDNHKFLIASTTSAAWVAANYTCQLYYLNTNGATDGIERITVEVKPNLITAPTYDVRTLNEQLLDAINAAMLRRATKEQLSMSISTANGGSKTLQYATYDELRKVRNDLQAMINGERAMARLKAGKPAGKKLSIRFNN